MFCEITIAELLYGALKGNRKENYADVELIRRLFAEEYINPSSLEFAKIRLLLKQKGTPVDLMDLFIASVALHGGYTLVTHNLKHFSRKENIKIEDWQ